MSGAPAPVPAPTQTTYKLKPLTLPDGRRLPIVLQAANGPCPLLAIANVLLLRGQIMLPVNAPDISEVIVMVSHQQTVSCCRNPRCKYQFRNNPCIYGLMQSFECTAALSLQRPTTLQQDCFAHLQERLVTLVAGWLLDTNNPAKMGHGASQEYKANLEQNLSDAVARIPKLTTGTVPLSTCLPYSQQRTYDDQRDMTCRQSCRALKTLLDTMSRD